MALIFRSYYAFIKNPRINSKGLNTSAMFGFTNSLLEILNKEKPTHIAIGFDMPGPTFRNEMYPEYKANRETPPDDLVKSFPYIEKIAAAFNIPIVKLAGYEADDIIGTLAKEAEKLGFETFMMTPDKDYAQLVSEKTKIHRPPFMGNPAKKLGIEEILEKWKISRIDQVIDILGLQGDAVDNIPGVPGVGEKTAQKLLAEFDTVENLVENTDQLKGKLKEKIENHKEQALLSKQLAVIKTDVPVEFDEASFLKVEPNKEEIRSLFEELEFRNLLKKVLGEAAPTKTSSKAKSKTGNSSQFSLFDTQVEEEEAIKSKIEIRDISNSKHDYYLIDTKEKRESLIHYLSLQDSFCFDTETTSVDAYDAEIIGLSFSYIEREAFYISLLGDAQEVQEILDEFKPIFENDGILKIAQNIKYDLHILKNYGIDVKGKYFDTMLAHYLLYPEEKHGMDFLAEKYLNYKPISIETLIGKKGKKQLSMRNADLDKVYEYACEDADITLQLKNSIERELKDIGLEKLMFDVEEPLINVLVEMERNGVAIDVNFLNDYSSTLQEDSKIVEQYIYGLAGGEFNIASPKQLGEILFEKLKLDSKAKKTKTGQYATGEEVLSKLSAEHEIANKILEFREINKLKSTYVDALPELLSKKDHFIHTSFNQTIAATGRLSSVNPNLQNIPIRTERGRTIRKAFVPREKGNIILSADYSQVELRVMSHFSEDETMMNAFKNGEDIHTSTASKVFHTEMDEVTSDMRRKAKSVNFGLIYGISAFGLANNLGISRTEAKEIIETYFEKFSAIKKFMDDAINKAREYEYAETILGRRRNLPDINSRNYSAKGFAERNAINAPIQGSAADLVKLAMIDVYNWMKNENLASKMILQVHDELVFDCVPEEVDYLSENVKRLMENAMELKVPLKVDFGTGTNWLEAH